MAEHKKLANGFEYLQVCNERACARIALQGAHLFHYARTGEVPLLWLSEASFFEKGKAIRGGIPICWPWFGRHDTDPALPQHGFARNFLWQLVELDESDAGATGLTFSLKHSEASLQLWPYRFELLLHIMVGKTLTLMLTTKNCDKQSFEISEALHSYFAVSTIDSAYIQGLAGRRYYDALAGEDRVQQGNVFITEEVDRIYEEVQYPLLLHDSDRSVRVDGQGSSSAVVWNPWIDKCREMTDMVYDAYQTMLCIETANARQDQRSLRPGEKHSLTVIIS